MGIIQTRICAAVCPRQYCLTRCTGCSTSKPRGTSSRPHQLYPSPPQVPAAIELAASSRKASQKQLLCFCRRRNPIDNWLSRRNHARRADGHLHGRHELRQHRPLPSRNHGDSTMVRPQPATGIHGTQRIALQVQQSFCSFETQALQLYRYRKRPFNPKARRLHISRSETAHTSPRLQRR